MEKRPLRKPRAIAKFIFLAIEFEFVVAVEDSNGAKQATPPTEKTHTNNTSKSPPVQFESRNKSDRGLKPSPGRNPTQFQICYVAHPSANAVSVAPPFLETPFPFGTNKQWKPTMLTTFRWRKQRR